MAINTTQQPYIDIDLYIRQNEPDKREKAYFWSTAIGLQNVDGLAFSGQIIVNINKFFPKNTKSYFGWSTQQVPDKFSHMLPTYYSPIGFK